MDILYRVESLKPSRFRIQLGLIPYCVEYKNLVSRSESPKIRSYLYEGQA